MSKRGLNTWLSIFVILIGIGVLSCSKRSPTVDMGELDSLKLLTLDSTEFKLTTEDMRGSLLAVVFNPWCDHCQMEAEEIRGNIEKLKDVTILMIGSVTLKEIEDFSERYKLDEFENIKFAYASPVLTYEILGAVYLPHMRLYDKDLKPIQDFASTTSVETILSHVKK